MKRRFNIMLLIILSSFSLYHNLYAQYWDDENNYRCNIAKYYNGGVNSVTISPDGELMASGGGDQSIQIWSTKSGNEIIKIPSGERRSCVCALSFSPDGKLLASGSADGKIRIWTIATGKEQILKSHSKWIRCIAFSPDGKLLAEGGDSKSVSLWSLDTKVIIKKFEISKKQFFEDVLTVAFSPDGKQLACGGMDETVKLWDVETGQNIKVLNGHAGTVFTIAFSSDGKLLAGGCEDSKIILWSLTSGEEIRTLDGHSGSVYSISFLKKGEEIVSCSEDHAIKIWSVITGKEINNLRGHDWGVRCISISKDEKILASGCEDNSVKLWDLWSGHELPLFQRKPALLKSDSLLAAEKKSTIIWSLIKSVRIDKKLAGNIKKSPVCVSFSNDSKILASCSLDSTLAFWEVETGVELKSFKLANNYFYLSWSPNGDILALINENDNNIYLWSFEKELITKILSGHSGHLCSIAFSPDGRLLASASRDNSIIIWSVDTGEMVRKLYGHSNAVLSVTFSPNSKLLASGGLDGLAIIWDIIQGKEKLRLQHNNYVQCVKFNPDGKWLACSDKHSLRLWSMETGFNKPILCDYGPCSISFSPDGNFLAGNYTNVIIWSVITGEELRILYGYSEKDVKNSVSFSNNGKYLASGVSWDNSIIIWALEK